MRTASKNYTPHKKIRIQKHDLSKPVFSRTLQAGSEFRNITNRNAINFSENSKIFTRQISSSEGSGSFFESQEWKNSANKNSFTLYVRKCRLKITLRDGGEENKIRCDAPGEPPSSWRPASPPSSSWPPSPCCGGPRPIETQNVNNEHREKLSANQHNLRLIRCFLVLLIPWQVAETKINLSCAASLTNKNIWQIENYERKKLNTKDPEIKSDNKYVRWTNICVKGMSANAHPQR
jgi:hypothetical protein